jgi:hypothetical protein
VGKRESASNDSCIILKFNFKFLLQLWHLWRITAISSVRDEAEEMTPKCPYEFTENTYKNYSRAQVPYQTIY